jgi:hypothetical protein
LYLLDIVTLLNALFCLAWVKAISLNPLLYYSEVYIFYTNCFISHRLICSLQNYLTCFLLFQQLFCPL